MIEEGLVYFGNLDLKVLNNLRADSIEKIGKSHVAQVGGLSERWLVRLVRDGKRRVVRNRVLRGCRGKRNVGVGTCATRRMRARSSCLGLGNYIGLVKLNVMKVGSLGSGGMREVSGRGLLVG